MDNERKYFKQSYLPYVIFWMSLFSVWYFFKWKDFPVFASGIYVSVLDAFLITLCVFLINTYVIPHYYKTKQYFHFALLAFIFILIFGLGIIASHFIWVRSSLLANGGWSSIYINNLVVSSYFMLFFFTSLGAVTRITLDRIEDQKDYLHLEKEKLRAELNALKNQINPHFMFNALNTLYYKIDRSNHEARDILLHISDLMRYHIYQSGLDTIPVEQELASIGKYILLQKERLHPGCTVEIHGFDKVSGFSIIPFLLLPLVENCFKHLATDSHAENQIKIMADSDSEWFSFYTTNSSDTSYSKEKTKIETGVGLENIRKRLELAYYGNHTFEARRLNGMFEVQLKLRYHAITHFIGG